MKKSSHASNMVSKDRRINQPKQLQLQIKLHIYAKNNYTAQNSTEQIDCNSVWLQKFGPWASQIRIHGSRFVLDECQNSTYLNSDSSLTKMHAGSLIVRFRFRFRFPSLALQPLIEPKMKIQNRRKENGREKRRS